MKQPYLSSILILAVPMLAACAGTPPINETRTTAWTLVESDPQAAATYLDGLDAAAFEDTPLKMLRAEAAARCGNLPEAARLYTEAVDHTSVISLRDQALCNLAVVMMQQDQPEAAYAALARVSPEAQEDKDMQRQMGVMATAAGRLDLARTHFKNLPEAEQQRVVQVLGSDFLNNR